MVWKKKLKTIPKMIKEKPSYGYLCPAMEEEIRRNECVSNETENNWKTCFPKSTSFPNRKIASPLRL